jgi:hypothetical protein
VTHIGLRGAVLLLAILICCGGPKVVLRAVAGAGCLIAILAALCIVLIGIYRMLNHS